MRLKKLELFGFKSFADKTEIIFDQGVTCVVGPNGCGKSNISDAIRWVLGERSAKLLRGSKMEDVIFNGTDFRKPLAMAEVSLTIDNTDRGLPIDYHEVTLARRLYRSGDSEYLINKSICRLKDIQDLILDTGIGSSSYSMIEQGRIDYILNADADERRFLIEEAAGISKYKVKKEEAIRKLERTEENRLRLNDIVHEVHKNIQHAERQAKKAERYREELEKLKRLEITKAFLDVEKITAERVGLQEEQGSRQQELQTLDAQLQETKQNWEWVSGTLKEILERYRQAESERYGVQSKMEQSQQQLKFNQEKRAEIANRQGQIEQETSELKDRIEKSKQDIQLKQDEINSIHGNREAAAQELETARLHLREIEEKFSAMKTEMDTLKAEAFQAAAETSKIRNESHRLSAFIESARQQKIKQDAGARRLQEEAGGWQNRKSSCESDLQKLKEKIQQASAGRDSWDAKLHTSQEQIQSLKHAEEQTQRLLHEKEAQLQFLQEMESILRKKETGPRTSDPLKAEWVKNLREIFTIRPGSEQALDALIDTLGREIAGIQHKLSQSRHAIEHADRQHLEWTRQQEEVQTQFMQARAQHESLESLQQGTQERIVSFERELELVFFETKELLQQEQEAGEQKAALEQKLAREEEKERRLRSQQETLMSQMNRLDQEKSSALEKFAEHKAHVSNLQEHHKLLEESLKIMREHEERNVQRLQDLGHEFILLGQRQEQLVADDAQLEKDLNHLQALRRKTDVSIELIHQEKIKTDSSHASLQTTLQELVPKQQQIQSSLHQFEMKFMDLNYQEKNISDRLLQLYRIPLSNLNAEDFLEEKTEAELLLSQIDALKQKVESLGTVNLLAIEEYEELKQRYEFLMAQQKDLEDAKEQLLETIRKINRTTKSLFEETFTHVQKTFQEYYQTLFRGGHAQLVLVDETNPLESGIDIVVQPPGKKPQHISLLSGGEKALTAIALLFALFKIKPSPFCVLDEVDAPLDEANVERFLTVLHSFLKVSQFIIVTHNRKTIAMGDVLYGVTMQEAGVSKLVSVKMNKDPNASSPVTQNQTASASEETVSA